MSQVDDSPLTAAMSLSRQMDEIGVRLHDLDVETLGIATQARTLLNKGQVEEGVRRIDEAMAIAVSGELDPSASEFIYCNTLCACRIWPTIDEPWSGPKQPARRGATTVFSPQTVIVACTEPASFIAEAEEEVRSGCTEVQGMDFLHIGWALYELGEIRLRKGDLKAAEEAFDGAHELGQSPQPGLALLRLTQGRIDSAMASIADSLSDDPWDHQPRANLLAAQVEIALAAGNLTLARAQNRDVAWRVRACRRREYHLALKIACYRSMLPTISLTPTMSANATVMTRKSNERRASECFFTATCEFAHIWCEI